MEEKKKTAVKPDQNTTKTTGAQITAEDVEISLEGVKKPCPCEGGTLVRFLQPTILALLDENPCHGYDLLQKIAGVKIWGDMSPDPSGVYRILREMEKKGIVKSEIVHNAGAGLGRKVYTLTEEGLKCKENWRTTLEQYQKDLDCVIALLNS